MDFLLHSIIEQQLTFSSFSDSASDSTRHFTPSDNSKMQPSPPALRNAGVCDGEAVVAAENIPVLAGKEEEGGQQGRDFVAAAAAINCDRQMYPDAASRSGGNTGSAINCNNNNANVSSLLRKLLTGNYRRISGKGYTIINQEQHIQDDLNGLSSTTGPEGEPSNLKQSEPSPKNYSSSQQINPVIDPAGRPRSTLHRSHTGGNVSRPTSFTAHNMNDAQTITEQSFIDAAAALPNFFLPANGNGQPKGMPFREGDQEYLQRTAASEEGTINGCSLSSTGYHASSNGHKKAAKRGLRGRQKFKGRRGSYKKDDLRFFKSLLPFMKDIPPVQKLILRSEIHNLIKNQLVRSAE